jgi:uncharacterized protein (DUF4415 family)
MKKEYDLKKMKSRPNPYVGRLKQQVTIRLRRDTVEYFKELARETGMKYQNLIDLYLADCAENRRRPTMTWDPPTARSGR